MSAAFTLQGKIYDLLSATSLTVYSNVPDNTQPPYVVVGDMTSNDWSADGETGFDITVTVHSWSVAASMQQVRGMMNTVYNTLNRSDPVLSGYELIGLDFESDDLLRDADGKTLHGVQRFRAKVRN